ncbi:potassium transporter Trk [Alkalihalobacillus alcalophilus ATCC 27647 = CGMCC 1.3604]|uniref:Potassium transporter Trk n=1 Tax=Alkalihalobacillus alcalophilus ATCC 27647 = CGMCC 1.3604 TaxID=1218173 RepID=A0A094WH65_ALKAL|nr:TrkA family potassium uptake protein [Alkalihalobacillus alcalophilus]KGA97124.1 potassium transporter Trk [Alkalihalobacillus alcalophilus ATCC 27647 = CGMCC 1.3604]MED1560604.1 TrkA family potassium uptake protein [Alkalihalobacillus alcalophilus]THG89080.1 potassium transporter Trk [Alkalihalobacillus alcalophilus ATCC 27647 = CGMCC 1.3604]
MKKQFVVIGLGRFGSSLTRTLIENNHEVLALDKDINLVEKMATIATHVVQGDSTDETVLQELGVHHFNHAVVAIGENLQASILTTLLLKEMGLSKVTAKATNATHGKVLMKIGVDQVVYPERDMGIRLGTQLSSDNLVDYIELSPHYNVVEMKAPQSMNGRTLAQLDIRATYGCNILAIKSGESVNISPKAEDVIRTEDILLMIGSNKEIRHMEDKYGHKW